MFFGLRTMKLAHDSSDWPFVSGIIVSSHIDSISGDNGTTYSAEVLYDYTVDNTKYSSNQVALGSYGSSNPGAARQTVNEYPEGKEVSVFYMPNDPEESVLEVGIHGVTYFLPVFGAVFFLSGLGMFIFLPRLLEKQASKDLSQSITNQ